MCCSCNGTGIGIEEDGAGGFSFERIGHDAEDYKNE